MFVFRKIWRALFSWNTRFEIRPFALLPTKRCWCCEIMNVLQNQYKIETWKFWTFCTNICAQIFRNILIIKSRKTSVKSYFSMKIRPQPLRTVSFINWTLLRRVGARKSSNTLTFVHTFTVFLSKSQNYYLN